MPRERSRSRSSRAPQSSHSRRHRSRSRSRSPRAHRRHHHHHHHHSSRKHEPLQPDALPPRPLTLPYRSRQLTKHDLSAYRNLFASYLDIQKQKAISDIDGRELKGRWKSFVGKWNRRELAEGWYDPATKSKADDAASAAESWLDANFPAGEDGADSTGLDHHHQQQQRNNAQNSGDDGENGSEDEDDYGPAPAPRRKDGPQPGTFSDLAERDDLDAAHAAADHAALRQRRKADRLEQKEKLEELVPREQGRERQLEKKRDVAAANRTFRDAADGGMADVAEGDVMGGGEADDFKARKKQEERKKSERELRKEEQLRARAVEREERLAGMREKEAKTMDMLKALARERYGASG